MSPRQARNQKTVIFLGAGASAADGAPVQSALFREYFLSPSIQERVDRQMKDALQRYFERLWGIDVHGDLTGVSFPTFEESLGMLDIADSRKETFRGMGDDRHGTATQELRNHLTALIALILQERLQEHHVNHLALLSALRACDRLRRTAFISLNYDIIIDNAIEYESIQHGEQRLPDYSIVFSPRPHTGGQPFLKGNVLLKVHGSLNWLYCPACNALSLFPQRKVLADFAGAPWSFRCSKCHELEASILVPPTFFKVMSNFYLQQIWKRAEEELRRAGRIVFCGYSFPDADIHIKYLLKRSEVNRMGAPPEVFIVNEHEGKVDEQRKMEKDRYLRFFRKKDRVHWTNLSFQQFAENPQLIEDQTRWR